MRTVIAAVLVSSAAFTSPAFAHHRENVLGNIVGQLLYGALQGAADEADRESYYGAPVYASPFYAPAPPQASWGSWGESSPGVDTETSQMVIALRAQLPYPDTLNIIGERHKRTVDASEEYNGHEWCGTFTTVGYNGRTIGPIVYYTVSGRAGWPKAAVGPTASRMCRKEGF